MTLRGYVRRRLRPDNGTASAVPGRSESSDLHDPTYTADRCNGEEHVAAEFFAGDILVTPVAGRYAIGRILADGQTQESLTSKGERVAAVAAANQLAGTSHRVLLYTSLPQKTLTPVNYEEIARDVRARSRLARS
jgi:hypothetical protein